MGLIAIKGKNIHDLREKRDWTQQHLANLLGIDVATVNRWEKAHDEEAPIRSTMYSVMLPILAAAGIELELSEEGRKEVFKNKKIDSGLVKKLLGMAPWPLATANLGWVMNPLIMKLAGGLLGMAGVATSKAESGAAEALRAVTKAILIRELTGMKPLLIELGKAWADIMSKLIKTEKANPDL